MFGNFFIKVADVFLNIFDFFKNFNFKNLKLPKRNKTKKEIDPKLFTKLNFSEVKKQKDTQNKLFNKLQKIFLKYFLGKKTIATEILMFLVLFAIAGFEIAGIYLTSIVMIYIFMLYFPKISQKHQLRKIGTDNGGGAQHHQQDHPPAKRDQPKVQDDDHKPDPDHQIDLFV